MREATFNKKAIYSSLAQNRVLFSSATLRYRRSMPTPHDPFDDLVITFKPEATPEEEDRFLTEFAHAIFAVARHLVATQDTPSDGDGLETTEL